MVVVGKEGRRKRSDLVVVEHQLMKSHGRRLKIASFHYYKNPLGHVEEHKNINKTRLCL